MKNILTFMIVAACLNTQLAADSTTIIFRPQIDNGSGFNILPCAIQYTPSTGGSPQCVNEDIQGYSTGDYQFADTFADLESSGLLTIILPPPYGASFTVTSKEITTKTCNLPGNVPCTISDAQFTIYKNQTYYFSFIEVGKFWGKSKSDKKAKSKPGEKFK